MSDVGLAWDDNSDNETEFRIERRTLNGQYEDIRGVRESAALIEGLQADTIYVFRVRARNAAGDSAYTNETFVSTYSRISVCTPGPNELCVQGSRFLIRALWRIGGQGPYTPGNAVQLTSDTGYFWFFNPANVEIVVKVLNACPVNHSFWVYGAGLTTVEVIWRVTDTADDTGPRGATKTYVNRSGTQFAPVQDTFPVFLCP